MLSQALLATQPPADPLVWPVHLAALLTVGLCVLLHYETIRGLIWALRRFAPSARVSLVGSVLTLVTAHACQIVLFAIAHTTLKALFGDRIGHLTGATDGSITDAFYFSAAVFTTVGFGDIAPVGPIRTLVGIEALAGLVLITWSASFTFLVMERCFLRTLRDPNPGTNTDTGTPPKP